MTAGPASRTELLREAAKMFVQLLGGLSMDLPASCPRKCQLPLLLWICKQ